MMRALPKVRSTVGVELLRQKLDGEAVSHQINRRRQALRVVRALGLRGDLVVVEGGQVEFAAVALQIPLLEAFDSEAVAFGMGKSAQIIGVQRGR